MAERRYDIDWLRNLIILLLFPFHTARIFDYWEPNYVKNSVLSPGLSWFVVLISYWFMPLMFWLAGAASSYSLEKRNGRDYTRERVARLFVPLVFGVLVIVPPQAYLAKLSQPGFTATYWQFLSRFFTDFGDLSGYYGTFTPAHLWFILYLFVFSLVLLPLFLSLRSRCGAGNKVAQVLGKPWVFLCGFILLTATEALPDPGGKNPFFFGVIFLAGYVTTLNHNLTELIDRLKFGALLLLLPYLPLWLVLLSEYAYAPDWSAVSIVMAFMRNLALWLTLIVINGYGFKYLNKGHSWLPYLSRAAYPVYILHQTVLLIIGYFVVATGMGVWPKFLVITLLSFIATLALYELGVRRTALTRRLFGVKESGAYRAGGLSAGA